MIYERYINFIKTVEKSKKLPVKYMYECIKDDTRSITGSNIREILILYDKGNVHDINIKHIKGKIKFCEIPKEEDLFIFYLFIFIIFHHLAQLLFKGEYYLV